MNLKMKTLMQKTGRVLLWLPRLIYSDLLNIARNFKPRSRL